MRRLQRLLYRRSFLGALYIALLGGGTTDPLHAADESRGFRLVNNGPRKIRAVYVSPASSPDWGENLMGRGLDGQRAEQLRTRGLGPGDEVEVTFMGPCGTYDVRFVAEQGAEYIEEEVKLCAEGDTFQLGNTDLKRLRNRGATSSSP